MRQQEVACSCEDEDEECAEEVAEGALHRPSAKRRRQHTTRRCDGPSHALKQTQDTVGLNNGLPCPGTNTLHYRTQQSAMVSNALK